MYVCLLLRSNEIIKKHNILLKIIIRNNIIYLNSSTCMVVTDDRLVRELSKNKEIDVNH